MNVRHVIWHQLFLLLLVVIHEKEYNCLMNIRSVKMR